MTGAVRDLSVIHSDQTGVGAYPASYTLGTGALSSEEKRPKREADHPSPSGAEVGNGGGTPPVPIRLHGVVLE